MIHNWVDIEPQDIGLSNDVFYRYDFQQCSKCGLARALETGRERQKSFYHTYSGKTKPGQWITNWDYPTCSKVLMFEALE